MPITHNDIQILIEVITGSVATIGWVVGISVTVMVTLVGTSLGIAFKTIGGRVEGTTALATAAQDCAKSAQDAVKMFTSTCASTRAGCREDLLGRFLEKSEIRVMESEFKNLVTTVMSQLQQSIREDRGLLVEKLDDLKQHQSSFQREIWEAVHGHKHADNGLVIRTTKNG